MVTLLVFCLRATHSLQTIITKREIILTAPQTDTCEFSVIPHKFGWNNASLPNTLKLKMMLPHVIFSWDKRRRIRPTKPCAEFIKWGGGGENDGYQGHRTLTLVKWKWERKPPKPTFVLNSTSNGKNESYQESLFLHLGHVHLHLQVTYFDTDITYSQ